jgi:hypothetical protein
MSMQLDDSVAPDHACFADSTDVFVHPVVYRPALWRSDGKRKTPIWGQNP